MKSLLQQFEDKKPEIVFEWNDPETEAEGWIVINSLRNGAAGGGTRMRLGLDRHEVESLAKTMEVKFTVSGPPIGGAKSGINFDPKDSRKQGVLERWYKAVTPLIKNYYGTGGDLNIDEINEVIPITENLGLWHPQEGVVNGHFLANEPQKIRKIGQLRYGVKKIIEDQEYTLTSDKKYTVADMITGFGVAESVRHFYNIWGGKLASKKAIIQGWGNVGGAAACYLAKEGVKIIGIIDKDHGLINEDGFSLEEIKSLFINRIGNKLNDANSIPFEEVNKRIWGLGAEIFIPAAASRLLSLEQVNEMINNNLQVVACGANVPFMDSEIFYGPIFQRCDQKIALIPDFVANCGMARVFAYLMTDEGDITDQSIFSDVSNTIDSALKSIYDQNKGEVGLAAKAYEIAIRGLI
ncbi:MAG: Glu/Leu/Phe/Val dehydrogenase dimerization domain-containing protein [Bacteroidota bacterium]